MMIGRQKGRDWSYCTVVGCTSKESALSILFLLAVLNPDLVAVPHGLAHNSFSYSSHSRVVGLSLATPSDHCFHFGPKVCFSCSIEWQCSFWCGTIGGEVGFWKGERWLSLPEKT